MMQGIPGSKLIPAGGITVFGDDLCEQTTGPAQILACNHRYCWWKGKTQRLGRFAGML